MRSEAKRRREAGTTKARESEGHFGIITLVAKQKKNNVRARSLHCPGVALDAVDIELIVVALLVTIVSMAVSPINDDVVLVQDGPGVGRLKRGSGESSGSSSG